MQSKISLRNGLEPLAVALILAPEPATTAIGLGLLAYARTQRYLQGKEQANAHRRACHVPCYTCKMKLVRGETIVYQTYPLQSGQLHAICPPEKGMYYNPGLWESYFKEARKKAEREKIPLINKPAAAVSPFNRPALGAPAFKRPAGMLAHVRSYRLPPLYHPQPAMAAARV